MNLVQGSTNTISVVDLKDAQGKSVPLPPGMVPTYAPQPPTAVTMGIQDAVGTQEFTIDPSFTGPLVFAASLAYPDGDPVTLAPITVMVIADEDVTGELAINAAPLVPPPAPAATAPAADATPPAAAAPASSSATAAAATAPADATAPAPSAPPPAA